MLTEDYLVRIISQAVAALVRAIGLRKEGQYTQALQGIDQALEQLTGLRPDLLQRLDERAILDALMVNGELDRERAYLLSDFYQEQGQVFEEQNHEQEARASRLRALNLTLEAALSSPELEALTLQEKVDRLADLLRPGELPFETAFNLFSYYEAIGSYGSAAQILEKLASMGDFQVEMRQEMIDFYRRLLEIPEAALENGGLQRSQVLEMLRKLEKAV